MSSKLISEFKKHISDTYVGLDVSEDVESEETVRFTVAGGNVSTYDKIKNDLKNRNGWSRRRGYLTTKAESTGYLPHNKQLFIVMSAIGIIQPDGEDEDDYSEKLPHFSDRTAMYGESKPSKSTKRKQEDSSDDDMVQTLALPSAKTIVVTISIIIAILVIFGRVFGAASSNTQKEEGVELSKSNTPIDIIKMKQDDILFGNEPLFKEKDGDSNERGELKGRMDKLADYLGFRIGPIQFQSGPQKVEEEKRKDPFNK